MLTGSSKPQGLFRRNTVKHIRIFGAYPFLAILGYERGVIEAVQVQELHSDRINCLSHPEVVHQYNTTTKSHIVYDGSAE